MDDRHEQSALRTWLAIPLAHRRGVLGQLRDDVANLRSDGHEACVRHAEHLEIAIELLETLAARDLREGDVEAKPTRHGLYLVRTTWLGRRVIAEAASIGDALRALAKRIERRAA